MKELTQIPNIDFKKKTNQKHVPGQPGSSRGLGIINKKPCSSKQKLSTVPVLPEGKRLTREVQAGHPARAPGRAGSGQCSGMKTQLLLVNRVLWLEGLSNGSSISSESLHLADKGNCVDIIHIDFCVTPNFGWADSSRTKSPTLCKHLCIVYIQRIKSQLSPMTSLELYLHCLPLQRFWIPRDDVPKKKKDL